MSLTNISGGVHSIFLFSALHWKKFRLYDGISMTFLGSVRAELMHAHQRQSKVPLLNEISSELAKTLDRSSYYWCWWPHRHSSIACDRYYWAWWCSTIKYSSVVKKFSFEKTSIVSRCETTKEWERRETPGHLIIISRRVLRLWGIPNWPVRPDCAVP